MTMWFMLKMKFKLRGVYDISINHFTGRFTVTPLAPYNKLNDKQKEACDKMFEKLRQRILGK